MYENLVFPGVTTIYDYINYRNNVRDTKTYTARSTVKTWDDFDKKDWHYYFSCGCTGSVLTGVDGGVTNTARMPFVKIEVREASPGVLVIDHDYYYFSSIGDAHNFKEFAKAHNDAIDRIIRDGIQECFSISKKMYSGEMAIATKNFVKMLPQQVFTSFRIYKATLRNISWQDPLFSEYANFNMDEIKQTYELIHNKAAEQAFRDIKEMFVKFAKVVSNRSSIPTTLSLLTSFLLVRQGAMEIFANQWKTSYDVDSSYTSTDRYIEKCVQKNILASSDDTAMTLLTYYLMSLDSTLAKDFYMVVPTVKAVVTKYEKIKKQESFENRLFQSASQTDSGHITIHNVDFMNGSEFENLICALFKKMGFQAYVTKHSGDQGIDVIAEKGTFKLGIQAKCYSSTVGNAAIQEAVAGKAYYNCDRVMVITNNTFTKQAETLATANNVLLWSRDILKEKLIDYPVLL